MAAETMTKSEFERYCNEQEHLNRASDSGWSTGSGMRTRRYGTWFRNADRDGFNEMYRLYVEEGVLP